MHITCSRIIGFDSAHSVMIHESKCKNLHGHRYKAEIEAFAPSLDNLGRIVDFSVLKSIIGGWIDDKWDHGTIVHEDDADLIELCRKHGWKLFILDRNPTAENLAEYLLLISNALMKPYNIEISSIKLWETPNCYSIARK